VPTIPTVLINTRAGIES